jgi:osmotically-inducible protein OsmY
MVFKLPFSGDSGFEQGSFGHRHAALKSAIASALAYAEDIDASDITVTIVETTIVLEGSVPSQNDMDRAMELAVAIAGAQVHNRLWRQAHH